MNIPFFNTQPDGHLDEPVTAHARKDFTVLRQDLTVGAALELIRRQDLGGQIVYFYVVDAESRLAGVVPTRRLLSAALDKRLAEIMAGPVAAIPDTAVFLDACELFARHKYLAFPVVDAQRRVVGVVDVGSFTDEVFNLAERERMDAVFETIGFRLSRVRDASPFRAVRFRLPWLLATMGAGVACALMAGRYEATLGENIVLAFFMTLVLGLGESVSAQTTAVTVQALRVMRPTLRWYAHALRREAGTALLLGLSCGGLAGLIVWLWQGSWLAAAAIGGSLVPALGAACFFGLSIPALLHALRLDPKIAAGPLTLAITDVFTLLFYFNLARLLL